MGPLFQLYVMISNNWHVRSFAVRAVAVVGFPCLFQWFMASRFGRVTVLIGSTIVPRFWKMNRAGNGLEFCGRTHTHRERTHKDLLRATGSILRATERYLERRTWLRDDSIRISMHASSLFGSCRQLLKQANFTICLEGGEQVKSCT